MLNLGLFHLNDGCPHMMFSYLNLESKIAMHAKFIPAMHLGITQKPRPISMSVGQIML